MKINFYKRDSIAFRLAVAFIIAALVQCLFMCGALIFGGVVEEAKINSFESFSEKINSRRMNLEGEMNNMWTNFSQYTEHITENLLSYDLSSDDQNKIEIILENIAPHMIETLRSTKTTGVFLILNNQNSGNTHNSIYIRDADPNKNSNDNSDLSLIAGPWSVSRSMGITTSYKWKYNLKLTEENRNFYDKAIEIADLSDSKQTFGYWCPPFSITPEDQKIITYSFAISDENGSPIGVFGVEINMDYLYKFLPTTDLQHQDSFGYIIGIQTDEEDGIMPSITRGILQSRTLHLDEKLSITQKDEQNNIYLLNNHNGNEPIYLCMSKLGLYYYNTPFENEKWYLIGIMKGSVLLDFPKQITNNLFVSLIICMVIGLIISITSSKRFTVPIVNLAKKVNSNFGGKPQQLESTGLREIDNLSEAIYTYQKYLLEMSTNVSRIIDLTNIHFGAFEIKNDASTVFMTNRLPILFNFSEKDVEILSNDKEEFIKRLEKICENKWEDPEIVNITDGNISKWIRISQTKIDTGILGVAIDVTQEVNQTLNVILERDIDPLTGIKNRSAYKQMMFICQDNIDTYSHIGIGVFDLNDLKKVNDTRGHSAGDEYLCAASDVICKVFSNCPVFRIGGDEFAVLFIEMEKDEIEKQHKDMLDLQKLRNITRDVKISIAFGYSFYNPAEDKNIDAVFKRADSDMYINKQKIKNGL